MGTMVVFWKGKGLWVAYLLLAALLLVGALGLIDKKLGVPVLARIDAGIGFGRFMGLLLLALPGIPMLVLGARTYARGLLAVFEPETGRVLQRRPSHHLYFINVFWWGLAASALGLGLLLR